MNRRKFLSWIGLGAATACVAPLLPAPSIDPFLGEVPVGATVGDYTTLANLSAIYYDRAALDALKHDCMLDLASRKYLPSSQSKKIKLFQYGESV